MPGPQRGEGYDFRELREVQPGDSFKRIAWRASARRGKLMVRDFEHHERDVVWFVVDASVELWAGAPGNAPLDLTIDDVAAAARRHLGRGDVVGLAILGGRFRKLIEPDRGPRHAYAIATALVVDTATYDADRSELDERDVATRVFEHLRSIEDPSIEGDTIDINLLALRAEAAIGRAPFLSATPWASAPRERVLRQYMAAFGMECPAKSDAERPKTEDAMLRLLDSLVGRRPKPSVVHVWAPTSMATRPELAQSVRRLRRTGAVVRWTAPRLETSIQLTDKTVDRAVSDAIILRTRIARERGERELTKQGVRVQRGRRGSARGLASLGTAESAEEVATEGAPDSQSQSAGSFNPSTTSTHRMPAASPEVSPDVSDGDERTVAP